MTLRRIAWATLLLLTRPLAACGETPAPLPPPGHPEPPAPVASASAPAPSASAVPAPPDAPPSKLEVQLRSLRDYVSAFNRHDAAAIGALYDQDAVFLERGEFTSIGESITANYQRHFDAFPDCTTAITRSWHEDDLVVFEYVEGGTNTGPHRAHPPTGKKTGYVGASVLRFGPKGLVVKDSTYYDELTMEVQLGWARGPLAKLEVRPVATVPAASPTWEVHAVTTADTGDRVSAVKKSLYSSFQLRSQKDYLAALSDDVVLSPFDDPKDAVGKREAGQLFDGWLRTFSAGVVDAEEAFGVDGHVVVLGTFTGTQVGPWGPLKATRKPFKSHFLDIVRVGKDDTIQRLWSYANNYEILRDLGYEQR